MSKINILVSSEYTKEPFQELTSNFNIIFFDSNKPCDDLNNIHCLCIRSKTKITKEFLEAFKNLKLIISTTAGQEHIDLVACDKANVNCTFIPEPSSESAAEHTLMLTLMLLRNYKVSQKAIDDNKWKSSYSKGLDVSALTFGIIGYGRVGKKFANALKSLGGEVITYDPYVSEAGSDLNMLLKKSDVVSFHVPATEETYKMGNNAFLNQLKSGCFIINTSRGSVLCEQALVEALNAKKLAGAALDVFDKEPLTENSFLSQNKPDNLIVTPHAGSWTQSSFENASLRACAEIVSFFK